MSNPPAQRDGDSRWWLTVGLMPAVGVFAPRAVAWLWADRMPDPIAVHWTLGGVPSGAMSLAANEAISTAMSLLFWGIGVLLVRNARAWRVRRTVAAFTTATIAFLGLLDVTVLWANLDQSSWQDARMPGWVVLPVVLLAFLIGTADWVLSGRPPVVDTPVGGLALTDRPPTAGLPRGTRDARWEGASSNRWLGLLGAGLCGAALVAAPLFSWWLVLPGVVVLLACGTVAVLHVRCDEHGLVVRYGLLGWPVQRIPLERIAVAHAIDLDPTDWGGWGYRWAPGQNGAAAVTRRGPAIVVQRKDGRRFAVTVDDAVTGAGVLNDLRPDRPAA